jgi:hypothetical protein
MLKEEDKTPPVVVSRHTPPPGRPRGAITTAELVEKVRAEVAAATSAELERRLAALRAELRREVRATRSLAIVALATGAAALLPRMPMAWRWLPAAVAAAALVWLFFRTAWAARGDDVRT